jgi:hypothetical protein
MPELQADDLPLEDTDLLPLNCSFLYIIMNDAEPMLVWRCYSLNGIKADDESVDIVFQDSRHEGVQGGAGGCAAARVREGSKRCLKER